MPSDSANLLRRRILDVFLQIYNERRTEGAPEILDLADDAVLLETGLDSLGFAILVTRLEEELDYDPFSLSAEPFYPRTFKEFVEFYRDNAPT